MSDLDANADVTIGQRLLSVAADFKASLNSIDRGINKLSARAEYGPVHATVQGTAVQQVANAQAVLAFDNDGGPAMGQIWNVRRLVVGGIGSPLSAVAGAAWVFVSSINPNSFPNDPISGMSMLELVDNASTLPNVAFYGEGELRLVYPEKLYVIFTGGANGDKRAAVAFIQVVQEGARVQVQNT